MERAILWEGTRAWGGQEGNRDHAVLRWNATGTEWGAPIARTAVTVMLPRGFDDSQLTYDAWTGVYGARRKDLTKRRDDARTFVFETDALRSGEGITVDVTMPGDAVSRPGWMSEATAWLADNFPFAVFPATLGLCVAAWFYRGRDLPGRGAIVVNYEPPDNLSRLTQDGYFGGNPKTVRGSFLGLGLLAVAVALGLCALVQFWMIGRIFVLPVAIAGVLSAIVVVLISRIMPRKTQKGRIAWEQITGLEE